MCMSVCVSESPSDLPISISQILLLQAYVAMSVFYMGIGGLNSGPHACIVTILSTDPSS